MGIAFVRAGTGATTLAAQGSLTYAADATGGSCLIVGAVMNQGAGSATVSGVTYNGVAMTQSGNSPQNSPNFGASLWYLDAPATGSHNVVVTMSAATEVIIESGFILLSGTLTPNPAGGNNGRVTASATDHSVSVTTAANNSWLVEVIMTNDTVSGQPLTAAGTAVTQYSFSENLLAGQAIWGLTMPTTTAGSYSIGGTTAGADADRIVALEIKAAVAAVVTSAPSRLSLLGVS